MLAREQAAAQAAARPGLHRAQARPGAIRISAETLIGFTRLLSIGSQKEGRFQSRKSGGTWLTTRSAVRALILSLESETRGRPRKLCLSPGRAIRYTRTPELLANLADIQRLRAQLREMKLGPEQERQLWDDLTTQAVYHTTHLEGNELTFEEAKAVIDAHRQSRLGRRPDGAPQP